MFCFPLAVMELDEKIALLKSMQTAILSMQGDIADIKIYL